MIDIVSVKNMRESDRKTIESGTPSKELMYRAGEGIFSSVKWGKKNLIVCGTGNNAGDGYVVASILREHGICAELLLLEEKFSPDGKYYFDMAIEKKVPWSVYNSQNLDGYDVILDCIFGTGFRGEVTGKARELIAEINKSGAYVVSADINSGLNGDSGMGADCVRSDLTVSVGTLKSGHALGMAKDKMRRTVNVDIGICLVDEPYGLLEKGDVREFFGRRDNFSNKSTYGYITLLGGCTEYAGAAKLANMAASAMRSGAGVVKLAVPSSLVNSVSPYLLESTLYPLSDVDGAVKFNEKEIQGALKGVKALGIGMGLGQRGENEKILEYVLKCYDINVVIDADGLNTLSKMDKSLIKNSKCKVILTPHPKELERLTGISVENILECPIEVARNYAKETGAVVLLKGPATVITDGDRVLITNTGCPGMATAGSGDVLSGIITALCGANGDNPLMCAAVGAYINGLAGEIAQQEYGCVSMVASDTSKSVASAVKKCLE